MKGEVALCINRLVIKIEVLSEEVTLQATKSTRLGWFDYPWWNFKRYSLKRCDTLFRASNYRNPNHLELWTKKKKEKELQFLSASGN